MAYRSKVKPVESKTTSSKGKVIAHKIKVRKNARDMGTMVDVKGKTVKEKNKMRAALKRKKPKFSKGRK